MHVCVCIYWNTHTSTSQIGRERDESLAARASVQARRQTSDVTADAFKVASRRLPPVAGAIGPEGGTDTIDGDNDDKDSTDADLLDDGGELVDDGGRRAPKPKRRMAKATNDRNAAVRSQQAVERLDPRERCARSSPSARR